jgi:hypothetical protein
MKSVSPLGDMVICVWIALAAAAFWAPYFGYALPAGPSNALYAVFLLVSLTVLALRLVRQNPPRGAESSGALPVPSPKEDALPRGR